jgi:pyruvate carboxylase
MPEFRKILVANRGEIAIRVMRAANEMGKKTVAVYAEEDKLSLHRFKADEAYLIGEGLARSAPICRSRKSSGWRGCRGPMRSIRATACCRKTPISSMPATRPASPSSARSADTMRALGDKASARRVAIEAGVPVIPATEVLGDDFDAIRAEAAEVGYPLMLKASWGGGGRGMRPILNGGRAGGEGPRGPARGRGRLRQRRGLSGKDDPARPPCRGADPGRQASGNVWHLWERDCTVQRRNQKVVERAPAPYLTRPSARKSAPWR